MMKRISYLLLLIVVVLTGCGTSTKVTSSWTRNLPPTNVMDKVMVIAVMVNREEQDKTESEMVAELRKYGIDAYSGHNLLGPRGFRGMTEEEITQRLSGSDYTSVMFLSLVDKNQKLQYVPGTYYTSPYAYGYPRYYRRYWSIYDTMYTPGYYRTSTSYVLQAEIFTVNDDDELIYSAQTRTTDPGNAHTLAEGFAKTIVGELRDKGLVRQ